MPLDVVTICLSGFALLASGFAIWQTQRFQDRPRLYARWDRIGLTGGIEETRFGTGEAAHYVPFMKVTISNFGRDHARLIDLQTSTSVIGFTQQTDDGVRPYQEKTILSPGESWEVHIPLFKLQETFDHPFTVLEATLQRPVLTLRWLEYYSGRMRKRRIELDGPWFELYGEMRQSILETRDFQRRRSAISRFVEKSRFWWIYESPAGKLRQ